MRNGHEIKSVNVGFSPQEKLLRVKLYETADKSGACSELALSLQSAQHLADATRALIDRSGVHVERMQLSRELAMLATDTLFVGLDVGPDLRAVREHDLTSRMRAVLETRLLERVQEPPKKITPADIVNGDLPRIAASLEAQADDIRDEEPYAHTRRPMLIRAAAHLRLAFAELESEDPKVAYAVHVWREQHPHDAGDDD
jgi:hypothetical protein